VRSLDNPEPHYDHVAWVGAEYSFGPLDERVPYPLLGAVTGGYHTLEGDGWLLFPQPGAGAGVRYWNTERTWFVAPEVSFAVTAIRDVQPRDRVRAVSDGL